MTPRPGSGHTTLSSADWLHPRRGLADLRAALTSPDAAIAYLGMSVTAQRDGFRPQLHQRLEAAFGARHVAVNAGIGAVQSVACAFLMDDLVLPRAPQLCFVECTTGDFDGKSRHADIGPSVEGIVRKLHDHGCEVCILHLFRTDREMSWSDPVIAEYERVADHYGVSSISVGRRIACDLASGCATLDAWYRDVVHTTTAGAHRIADIVIEGLQVLTERNTAGAARRDRALAAPMHADHYSKTRIVPADELVEDRTLSRGTFRLHYGYLVVDSATKVSFSAAGGEMKGLLVVVGPTSGAISVSTPSGTIDYQLWDEWCTYERLSAVIFEHTVPAGTNVTIAVRTELKLIGCLVRQS